MKTVIKTALAVSVFGLVACANTNTESPIYKQSTLYKASVPQQSTSPVRSVSYETQTYETQPALPVNYENTQYQNQNYQNRQVVIYSDNDEAGIIADTSETDIQTANENIKSYGEEGTPGYYAVNNIDEEFASAGYSQTQITTKQQEQKQPAAVNYQTPVQSDIKQYVITDGDTLYSLARKNCTSVAELQKLNQIGDDFYIRAGDTISLPAMLCAE